MKSSLMRAPLIKSAAVLVLFGLLVYFTGTSAEGSVWGSLGMVVMTIIRLIQWGIGMVLGIALCLAVLIGIFLGAVAMVDRDVSAGMYRGVLATLATWVEPVLLSVQSVSKCEAAKTDKDKFATPLNADVEVVDSAELNKVTDAQADLGVKLEALTAKLEALEATTSSLTSTEDLAVVAAELKASTETLTELQQSVTALESSVSDASQQLQGVASEKTVNELAARLEGLEKKETAEPVDLQPFETRLDTMQSELAALQVKPAQNRKKKVVEKPKQAQESPNEAEKGYEHRLFSYFEDVADKKELKELVEETLKKDMTYAQIMSFLVQKMGAKKGEIISDHPSLAKDYIRQCRRA